ncbi:MAG: hypothetical protein BWK75_04425 [Candidatus Altiarchaeales archaeon A3]|nr:MAG: hypothetical protein BWK75_04425 [Candidatus Altiarchaeales archaeon A3]
MNISEYFKFIGEKVEEEYKIAGEAKSKNLDPENFVEAVKSKNLAERVEALVGPKGVALAIQSGKSTKEIIDEILDGKYGTKNKEQLAEQAVRTGLAIETQGVVAAPIEGINKISIEKNPDGTSYLSVYFAGPIRSAGGTAQGLTVLMTNYIQNKLKLEGYRPLEEEVERYVHEVILYNRRCKPLQYCPTEDEIRTIVKNVPVCVDGDPTEDVEVMAHRDLKRIPTNNIRGGACLVIGEGLALKAKKLAKKAKDFNINWDFLLSVGKKKKDGGEDDKDYASFMSEIVGGRPIFSFSNTSGGFRLRYGRSRASGIAGKSMHPVTMIVLDDFIATGTQIKMDRPGKGAVITSCDSIEGPIVKLKNGNVLKVRDMEIAKSVKKDIEEILFLGDILISFCDFLQTNTPLLPSGYVEEWYQKDLKKVGIEKSLCEINAMSAAEAVEISLKYNIPLHPNYLLFWEDMDLEKLRLLLNFLGNGNLKEEKFYVPYNKEKNAKEKRTLEILGNEHVVENGFIVISNYVSLLFPLGMLEYDDKKFKFNQQINLEEQLQKLQNENYDASLPLANKISKVMIRKKAGTYIGTRMGRPEKAKERKMQPPVHCLFPIGKKGGRERLINEAIKSNYIDIEISDGIVVRKGEINIKEIWDNALKNLNLPAPNVKCVESLISAEKVPEKIEKGILRAKNDVFVFKDGTIRYDMTDVPMTHFKPKEIFTSVEKLKTLGYDMDYKGNPLVSDEQILELKCQDILVPKDSTDYLFRVAKFVDDELSLYYKMSPYYNLQKTEDLIGTIIVGLAPHTSAGIVGRIIGFCDATCCFAHPLWHTAKRRNTDGDEDAIMLLMETLLNFSKKFLPASRGGRMDAPLVVTMTLDANEVDDESHKVEVVESYPDDFYEYTLKSANPSDVKVKNIGNLLSTNPYENLNFTHDNGNLSDGVKRTKYVLLKDMSNKVDAQLGLAEKIRAVDEKVVAEILLNSHFLRDIQGNLRSFGSQTIRCGKCNTIYRRIPLIGKCPKCGENLILTINEGGIRKYLKISINIAEKYELKNYLRQRLTILNENIDSMFTETKNQKNLSEFW